MAQLNEQQQYLRMTQTPIPRLVTAMALVLGIAGVVTAFTGKFAFIGLICSVIGLVLSSRERACNPSSTVTAAFVLSIIGIASAVIGIIVFILILAGSIAMFSFF